MYLSLHYPTGIIAGALIGTLTACVVMKTDGIKKMINSILQIEKTQTVIFYLLLFIFTSQMMQMFNHVRNLGSFVSKTLLK